MSDYDKINIEDFYLTIQRLESKIDRLQKQLERMNPVTKNADSEWMTLKELQQYLPSHPSESTIRRLVSSHAIPSFRSGKRVLVKKADIDEWIEGSKRSSDKETESTTTSYISKQKSSFLPPWRQKSVLKTPNAG